MKKIPMINSAHGSDTRNIINEIIKAINDRGLEILSESSFLNWLNENGVRHLGEWDDTKEYDRLSVVLHEGNSYTSMVYVPAGVDILNEEYWAATGNYNAQVEQYRQDVQGLKDTLTSKADNDTIKKLENIYTVNVLYPPEGYNPLIDDGITDNSNNLRLLLQDFDSFIFPVSDKGEYLFETPVELHEGVSFKGVKRPRGNNLTIFKTKGTDLFNASGNGKDSIEMKNIKFISEGKTGICFNGVFGGYIEKCYFQGWYRGMYNTNAHSTHFIDSQFAYCARGLELEGSNIVTLERCHFTASEEHLSTGRNATAFSINKCTFNISSMTTTGVIAHGNVSITGCYFESFSTNDPETIFIDYSFSPYGNPVLIIEGCLFNAGGVTKHCIKLNMDEKLSERYLGGRIIGTFSSFREEPIIIGENNSFYLPYIYSPDNSIKIRNKDGKQSFKPITSGYLPSRYITEGEGFRHIPLDTRIEYDNVNYFNDSGWWRAPKKGIYKIEATINFRLRLGQENIDVLQARIFKVGNSIKATSFTNIQNNNSSGSITSTVHLSAIVELNRTQTLSIAVDKEIEIENGNYTIEYISSIDY